MSFGRSCARVVLKRTPGVPALPQVALRWSVQQGVAVIAGTGDPAHMEADLALWSFQLRPEEMAAISALRPGSPVQTGRWVLV